MADEGLGSDSIVLVRDGKEITREQFRMEKVDEIPKAYSPWFHLMFPSAVGIAAAAVALSRLRGVNFFDASLVPMIDLA